MMISVRLNDADTELIKEYAKLNHMSVSELVRQAVLEKIEEEYDLAMYYEAKAEHERNPVTHSHEEVKKMLGFEP